MLILVWNIIYDNIPELRVQKISVDMVSLCLHKLELASYWSIEQIKAQSPGLL